MFKRYLLLAGLVVISIVLYMLVWIASQYDVIMFNLNDPDRAPLFWGVVQNILTRRSVQVLALAIAAILIAMTTLNFQTLTDNRILTPSLLGFDSIYVVIQTTLIFFFSMTSSWVMNSVLNFILSVVVMSGMTILLYMIVLRKHKNNILLLLLIGMIISTLAVNYASFLQILMDPTEFQTVASLTAVSVVNIETSLTLLSLPVVLLIIVLFYRKHRTYDVMALGEDYARNLGVMYHKETYVSLILISIATAITTALVGPLSFLGLIAVNISREMFKKHQHRTLFICSSLIAMTLLIFGQSVIELIGFQTTVTTFISLFGGIYVIYLIVKEHKYDSVK